MNLRDGKEAFPLGSSWNNDHFLSRLNGIYLSGDKEIFYQVKTFHVINYLRDIQ